MMDDPRPETVPPSALTPSTKPTTVETASPPANQASASAPIIVGATAQSKYTETHQIEMMSAQFADSPYPPAEVLLQYNKVVPGLTERLVTMLEEESKHRRSLEIMEQKSIIADRQSQRDEAKRGQHYALTIGIVALLVGGITSMVGQPIAGSVIGAGGVIGLVAVFICGRYALFQEAGRGPSEPPR